MTPNPPTPAFQIRLSLELRKRIENCMVKLKIFRMAEVIRAALEDFLKKNGC